MFICSSVRLDFLLQVSISLIPNSFLSSKILPPVVSSLSDSLYYFMCLLIVSTFISLLENFSSQCVIVFTCFCGHVCWNAFFVCEKLLCFPHSCSHGHIFSLNKNLRCGNLMAWYSSSDGAVRWFFWCSSQEPVNPTIFFFSTVF